MISEKIKQYVAKQEATFTDFYKKSSIQRFKTPDWNIAQERIQRLGIEAKALNATDADELYILALTTLHQDYIKNV